MVTAEYSNPRMVFTAHRILKMGKMFWAGRAPSRKASDSTHHALGHVACIPRRRRDGPRRKGSLDDLREMCLGRMHPSRREGGHERLPLTPCRHPRLALREVSGAAHESAGARAATLPALRRSARGLIAGRLPAPTRAPASHARGATDSPPPFWLPCYPSAVPLPRLRSDAKLPHPTADDDDVTPHHSGWEGTMVSGHEVTVESKASRSRKAES